MAEQKDIRCFSSLFLSFEIEEMETGCCRLQLVPRVFFLVHFQMSSSLFWSSALTSLSSASFDLGTSCGFLSSAHSSFFARSFSIPVFSGLALCFLQGVRSFNSCLSWWFMLDLSSNIVFPVTHSLFYRFDKCYKNLVLTLCSRLFEFGIWLICWIGYLWLLVWFEKAH